MSRLFRESGIKFGDRLAISKFCSLDCSKSPSLTVQAPADEVDINKIMARVSKGQNIVTSNAQPFYGDVSDFGGLQDSIIQVQEANDLFMQFPADVRSRFKNDPVEFVDFFNDPKNLDEAISLGFAKRKPIFISPPGLESGGSIKPV